MQHACRVHPCRKVDALCRCALFGRHHVAVPKEECHQTLQACERFLTGVLHGHVDAQALAALQRVFLEQHFAGGVRHGHFGVPEGPSRARVHVHLQADLLAQRLGVGQHVHPAGREERNVVPLVALHAVDGCYFQSAHACLGIFSHVVGQVGRVDRAAQPPPAGGGACLGQGLRPCLGTDVACRSKQQQREEISARFHCRGLYFIPYCLEIVVLPLRALSAMSRRAFCTL
jgi:hypothetical protein